MGGGAGKGAVAHGSAVPETRALVHRPRTLPSSYSSSETFPRAPSARVRKTQCMLLCVMMPTAATSGTPSLPPWEARHHHHQARHQVVHGGARCMHASGTRVEAPEAAVRSQRAATGCRGTCDAACRRHLRQRHRARLYVPTYVRQLAAPRVTNDSPLLLCRTLVHQPVTTRGHACLQPQHARHARAAQASPLAAPTPLLGTARAGAASPAHAAASWRSVGAATSTAPRTTPARALALHRSGGRVGGRAGAHMASERAPVLLDCRVTPQSVLITTPTNCSSYPAAGGPSPETPLQGIRSHRPTDR